ncbi:MAG: site-2 protease family protein, partial [Acidobacteria bacterium]|nr:site-2 protease family protein [Acidobacteriota bacterium]
MLGVMIFIHEMGHYLAAKLLGIRVEVFSLGFGRRLFGFKRGDT